MCNLILNNDNLLCSIINKHILKPYNVCGIRGLYSKMNGYTHYINVVIFELKYIIKRFLMFHSKGNSLNIVLSLFLHKSSCVLYKDCYSTIRVNILIASELECISNVY